ncbi:cytochrome d ubiquinol oxidase subunit II [Muribaculaceae bacterium Isolate-113 (HZI)]|jgi:cytochrome d ubiquinol oxidase subunit II|uniref:cytochrome d ubiquinol oxidase subunit II n=1 Tax=Sangeribacter muris TaxID=2880703 RepID=UPI000E9B5F12|nr:cytochrome d ubiquinol oxidase subunit II [Sangeribacter muris]MBJ2192181.1 cytochrome d ubiquinol oxidase subunit II [Muribaculaceae bacterium]ROS82703.1 cytochrome d ubiquinol oxidase subunit II [Muribaculaceae bacterium Isolate-036 (Harlan)]ROT20480.1 cytochrome d ubiquinol oxidase subunit II [Muribaculaceae bacterium Isolate-114 (HZI)]ROT23264.1 cytochrome d ubiquinol oxidase subunit II [Muribaculaceae bacterium Isolate-113 (HZI)]RXE66767.1 cytochrome d ubiquinol oxidase subunit II [Mur
MSLEYLQNYWWLLVSVLGGILVFLLFVQGGQSMILSAKSETRRDLIVNSMGGKWELTFTTLVTFGGAAFASFPLFYSTSFGGAYWLWILILFSFIVQAVSYEYRRKKGNVYGTKTYDIFLFINGCVGCVLLGVAVSMFFFGGEFTVNRGNLLDGSAPVISQWAPTHGFEAIFNWKNLVLGVAVLFLARTQACLYMMNNIADDPDFFKTLKAKALINGGIFLVFFLWFLGMLLTATGYTVISDGIRTVEVQETPFKYLHNYINLWWAGVTLLLGVVLVLLGWAKSCFAKHFTKGIWFTGIGTFLVVASLFWVAGYGDTAFYPSLLNPMDSLTIRNASSSEFTLKTMSYVSLLIPFVLAYIVYVWRAMDKKKLTPASLESTDHKY